MADPKDIKPGDWVRFYRNAELVIGVVQYVGTESYPRKQPIYTDVGSTMSEYVLEVKRG